ncbi:hypothetical protein Taro_015084 [Colocasia esculenta]|uniref:non-specific serine/threonine protein kinase n=1 Tax=Colocasia esculenta TaxID=4460 RepID=A0A843UGT4_COLES|nr:hypothetical protein [Colocasia esculenta]
MPRRRTTRPCRGLVLLLVSLLSAAFCSHLASGDGLGAGTRFDFATLTLGSLKLLGDAHLRNNSIRLSPDLPVPNSGAGRVLYSRPVLLRHPETRAPLSFSTFFSFSVTHLNPSSIGGGLAFVLASDDGTIGDPGGFLGLINGSAAALEDGAIVVGVEFDTLMDVEFSDINGNHVGVDLNSMVSTKVADLDAAGVNLKSGDLVNAWVEYDGAAQVLQVFVSYSTVHPGEPVISFPLDLGRFVNDFMYVGFSGSTQGSTEVHSIEWWSFASAGSVGPAVELSPPVAPASAPPPPAAAATTMGSPGPPPNAVTPSFSVSVAESPKNGTGSSPSTSSCQNNGLCRQGPAAVAGVATAGAFFLAVCAGLLIWVFTRRTKSVKRSDNLAVEIVRMPREFSYKELSVATRGFDRSRVIGHGAFGTVYKGIVPETGAMVAVKRCINGRSDGGQGKAEFLSELSIIAGLRHRNLVRLQGWCHEKGEILLVYDYMPNGSLDKALFEPRASSGLVLSWRHRRRILAGVASALAYLHRECEWQVIHRDVKSSNVMLDEDFQARLGDFGLARQVEHDKSPDATVTAGTMGYLAPEYLLTGRATEKTDVFSFGAVVLEVACGRRPIESTSSYATTARGSNLVEWVWGLHGEGRLLEAVDRRLGGEFEEGEMRKVLLVGLGCSHPDPAVRPSMRGVVQMLSGEADPPFVPTAKPSMSFSANRHLLLSLQDSVSDCNAMAVLSTSSSASSVSTTLIAP